MSHAEIAMDLNSIMDQISKLNHNLVTDWDVNTETVVAQTSAALVECEQKINALIEAL